MIEFEQQLDKQAKILAFEKLQEQQKELEDQTRESEFTNKLR